MRQWLIGIALLVSSCAEAVDDQPTDLPGPPPVVGSTKDTGTSSPKDTGAIADSTLPVDSGAPEDTSIGEDTSIVDTTTADTGELDTGTEDTALPDTFVPPVDTGPGGACMYCSTGTCPLPLADYGCLLNCLLDGYLDCHYDPGASMPCTCKL